MKITVVGAGAVGGYFGGRLQQAGADVTYLVREKRAEQLKQTGLVIQSPRGDDQLVPKIATRTDQIEGCDLIILGVKNYHIPGSIDQMRPLVEKGAYVLPLLNGVEHYDLLEKEFGKGKILGGLCYIISTLDAEGRILHTNLAHEVRFGPLVPEQQAFCEELTVAAKGANMKLVLSEDIQADIWNKYGYITAYSGVTTASRLSIDKVLKCEPTKEVFRQSLVEMWQLARHKGVNLAESFIDISVDQCSKLPEGSTSSMHQDFRKGLPLEVESLQGAAVRLAKQAGIEIPTIKTLYGLIKPYENGSSN
ncbi:ketopantoate reductase family protein [Effusibacillus dendaii]|uniref:2-dehydropantoate 2-reductase n=1 Tax=Effusibacillus dendaii TaxID=2743772 RepID=A0A7I8DEX9_9BACL|nr:ketopantoate reductase family protein [Effusibacillus dendaii]BCJ87110.1 2-dehydropantoate 2-reductase [Effusibacillus dendaii]